MVTIPVGETMVAKIVYRNCPITLPNRVTHVELVELDVVDFNIILGICCMLPLIVGQELSSLIFLLNPSFSGKGEVLFLEFVSFLVLKACNIMSKGCLYHIVRVKDLDSEVSPIE